jgi:D-sedoheptulose 7-phosphate isomerase
VTAAPHGGGPGAAPAAEADLAARVAAYKARSLGVLATIPDEPVARLIGILDAARRDRRRVFVCGNGGSAATASHFVSGLGKEGSPGSAPPFRALALTDNVAWLTALANDTAYSEVFVGQLRNHADAGDVLVAFSVSGRSPSVLRAVAWANEHGLVTVGITGAPGGELRAAAAHAVVVPSADVAHVEEAHFLIQHLVTYAFAAGPPPGAA